MADHETKYGEEYQAPYEAPQDKKKSGCLKWFLIVGGLGVLSMLTCCIGGAFYLKSGVVSETAELRQLSENIVNWDLPNQIEPIGGCEYFFVRGVVFIEKDKGSIYLFDSKYLTGAKFDDAAAKQFQDAMKRSAGNADGAAAESTEVLESGTKEIEIKGETCEFVFNSTKGTDSGKEYWELMGLIPGNERKAIVICKLLKDQFTEAAIVESLTNIK